MWEEVVLVSIALLVGVLIGMVVGYRLRTRASLRAVLHLREEREARLHAEQQLNAALDELAGHRRGAARERP